MEAHPYWRNGDLIRWCQASRRMRPPLPLPQCLTHTHRRLCKWPCLWQLLALALCTGRALQERGIHVTAYSPLGSPHTAGFFNREGTPVLSQVGAVLCCAVLCCALPCRAVPCRAVRVPPVLLLNCA